MKAHHREPSPPLTVGSSMALLTDLMQRPLDPVYQLVADQKARQGKPTSTGLRTPLLAIAAVLIGIMLATAAHALRVPADAARQQREQIIGQIQSRQGTVDQQTKDVAALQKEIRDRQNQALTRSDTRGLKALLNRTAAVSGAVAVHGPGIRLTLDDTQQQVDGKGVDPRATGSEQISVTSTDLQIIVNGLWQSGAEAVSINGQRLTSESAIRFAGSAILVDYRPLSRPYVVSVIGQPTGMRQRFEADSGGQYLKNLISLIGLKVKTEDVGRLDLPPSTSVGLHSATPVPSQSAPSSSSTRPKETP